MINEKEVSDSTRRFLQNWYANKEAKKRTQKLSKERAESIDLIQGVEYDSLDPKYPNSLDSVYDKRNLAVAERLPNSKHILKHHKQFVEVLAKASRLPPLEQSQPRYKMKICESPVFYLNIFF